MTSKKKKRPSVRPRRTAIVPRVVFQTMVAMAVVPAAAALPGCGQSFGVALTRDAGPDSGFSVVAVRDGGPDANFGVADAGRDAGTFSVAVPLDSGLDAAFSVAAPIDAGPDQGFFAVVAFPLDGEFSVLVAPFDANTAS